MKSNEHSEQGIAHGQVERDLGGAKQYLEILRTSLDSIKSRRERARSDGITDLTSYDRDIAEIQRRIRDQLMEIERLEIEVLENFNPDKTIPN